MSHVKHAILVATLFAGLLTVATPSLAQLKNETVVSGLKEALFKSTQTAVSTLSQVDGFYKNDMVKIRLPDNMQRVADTLGKIGLQQQIDDFVLSMNRAAELAAPRAAEIFVDAIRGMEVKDAFQILEGGDTAATEYLKDTTSDLIYTDFKPVITESMGQVGARNLFDTLMDNYAKLPFASQLAKFDLDDYVTQNAIGGLFHIVAQEERQIRENPAARASELLKTVFGQ